MAWVRTRCAGIALALTPMAAFAAEPPAETVLVPAGPWRIISEPTGCDVSREWRSGDRKALLSFEEGPPFLGEDNTGLWVSIGILGAKGDSGRDQVAVSIDGTVLPDRADVSAYNNTAAFVRKYKLDTERHSIGELKGELALDGPRFGGVRLQSGQFDKLWPAIATCIDEIYHNVGTTRADVERVATPPRGSTLNSLPRVRWGKSFDFETFFWVEPTGRISGCRLLVPTENAEFNRQFCPALELRGRYKPGLDSSGKPVRAPTFEIAGVLVVGSK